MRILRVPDRADHEVQIHDANHSATGNGKGRAAGFTTAFGIVVFIGIEHTQLSLVYRRHPVQGKCTFAGGQRSRGGDVMDAQMPVRGMVGRRQQPRVDRDIGPGVLGRDENRDAVLGFEGRVERLTSHTPRLALILGQRQDVVTANALDRVRASRDRVAKGRAICELAVL